MIKFRYKRKEPTETTTSSTTTAAKSSKPRSSVSTLPKSTRKACPSPVPNGSLTRNGTLQKVDNGNGTLQKNGSVAGVPRVACGAGLQKAGSSSSLTKAPPGLHKAGSAASLQKVGSTSSLQRSRAGTPVQKLDAGKVVQKTATRVSLQKTVDFPNGNNDHRKSEEMLHNGGDYEGVKKNNTLPRTKNEKAVQNTMANSAEMTSLVRNLEVSINRLNRNDSLSRILYINVSSIVL